MKSQAKGQCRRSRLARAEQLEPRTLLSVVSLRPAPLDAGETVSQVLAGDFNGDGHDDVLVASSAGRDLRVFPGNSDGTFRAGISSPQNSASALNVTSGADVNGDGKLDVIGWTTAGILYYPGRGDGSFGQPITVAQTAGQVCVATLNVNGDGRLDLATTDAATLRVLLQNPDGSFTQSYSVSLSNHKGQGAVADFNGDGRPDLAVASPAGVTVLRNAGDGTFSASLVKGTYYTSYSGVAAGDFNGDGHPDLAISIQAQYAGIDLALNAGDGTFGPALGVGGVYGSSSPVVANLTGDDKADLVVGPFLPSFLGGGTFTGATTGLTFAIPPFPVPQWTIPYVADFNGDGLSDIVAAPGSLSSHPIIYLSNRIVSPSATAIQGQPDGVTLATFTDNLAVNAPAPGISATINWGDSSQSSGVIVFDGNGAYHVSGTHTYATNGTHKYTVTLRDSGGQSVLLTATTTVTGLPPVVGPATLVNDLNTAPAPSNPAGMVALGNITLFSAVDPAHGRELWRTDGTAAGTWLVKDINPGWAGSSPQALTAFNGAVYFGATGPDGSELWKTDGTEEGTVELAAFPKADNSIRWFFPFSGKLYFAASTGGVWTALWATDGTPAGTQPITSSDPAHSWGTSPHGLTAFAGQLYFLGDVFVPNQGGQTGLYQSDGTPAGTSLVDTLQGSKNNLSEPMATDGSRLFMTDGKSLWMSDGTASGMTQPVSGLGGVGDLTMVNGKVIFAAGDAAHGLELWASDGTVSGTGILADIQPGIAGSNPSMLTRIGEALYFRASGPDHWNSLWETDGTAAGTAEVIPATGTLNDVQDLVSVNGTLYFDGQQTQGGALWKSDGTAQGTVPVAQNPPGIPYLNPSDITDVNGTIYFAGNDPTRGRGLWKSDGTADGTVFIANVNDGTLGSDPASGVETGGKFVFPTNSALYVSDGTADGTVALATLNTAPAFGLPTTLVQLNGIDYFAGFDPAHSVELWKTDGTVAGTSMVLDIDPGPLGSAPNALTIIDGQLYFLTSWAAGGVQLWRSDGTAAGTAMVSKLSSFGITWPHAQIFQVGGHLLVDWDSLYLVDGTSAPRLGPGSYLPQISLTSPQSPSQQDTAILAGQFFYISASSGGANPQLWRSDGTVAGTAIVTALGSQPITGPSYMTVLGNKLLFGLAGKLWVSDGTASGTTPLANLNVTGITIANGVVYVAGDDGVYGTELWTTDGTAAGTTLLADINPGPAGSAPAGLAAIGNLLYFNADDGQHGRELWMSDGTFAGTRLVQDINLDPAAPAPTVLGLAGGRVYFAADDGVHGMEPWSAPLPAAIHGSVFNDLNHDGVRAAGESGFGGVTVYLDANNNGSLDPGEASVQTDADGAYTFGYVTAGNYVVRQVAPSGWALTAPLPAAQAISLSAGRIGGPIFGDVQVSTVTMDFSYLLALAQHYNRPGTFATGDVNGDGTVGFADLLIVAQHYNRTLQPVVAASAEATSRGRPIRTIRRTHTSISSCRR